ncbi:MULTISPECIES: hypothetical protein [Bacillota]|uniref:hypothetical protein n=1 Tax=Sporofaciens musculi TaxID=2681861 RepID=UPI001FCB2920|nr:MULTISPECIES: hypothetical protein [Bacillota]
MEKEISLSAISAMSLVAMPMAFKVAGVLKSVIPAKSSRSKYPSVSRPQRLISMKATLFTASRL